MKIIIGNANRSRVVSEMTLEEAKQAKLVDGRFVVSVPNHKTDDVYGSSKIVLDHSENSWLQIYVD